LKFILFDEERDAKAIDKVKYNLRAIWVLMLATYILIGMTVLIPKLSVWLANEGFAMINTPTVWYEYPSTFLMYTILNISPFFLFFSTMGYVWYLVRYRSGMFEDEEEETQKPSKNRKEAD
jgi:hypothetical protein